MKCLVVDAPQSVRLADRDPLSPATGQVVIRPTAVGLCGTDLEIIDGRIDPSYVHYPLVLGHEWTGTVLRPGADSSLKPGTRVVVEGIVACGRCAACVGGATNLCETYDEIGFTRDGAAAEEISVPSALVHQLEPRVHPEDAALIEPCAVAYRALRRANPTPGWRILVVGDGTLALLATHLARLWAPAHVAVCGLRPQQKSLAVAAGASSFSTGSTPPGDGFDLVIEAAGTAQASVTALESARRGGIVVLLGLPGHEEKAPVAIEDLVNNDLTVFGCFGYTSSTWREAVTLLNSGALTPRFLITHRFRLEDWAKAIAVLRGAQGCRGKVLLLPAVANETVLRLSS
jgi:2-desacetyl-2-hydroxyethyl bacteriochlorophyllide A dehydrogenase